MSATDLPHFYRKSNKPFVVFTMSRICIFTQVGLAPLIASKKKISFLDGEESLPSWHCK